MTERFLIELWIIIFCFFYGFSLFYMLIGRNENRAVRKHVVVLGESRLKQKKQIKNDFDGKKQKPYNHCKIYMHKYLLLEGAFEILH